MTRNVSANSDHGSFIVEHFKFQIECIKYELLHYTPCEWHTSWSKDVDKDSWLLKISCPGLSLQFRRRKGSSWELSAR